MTSRFPKDLNSELTQTLAGTYSGNESQSIANIVLEHLFGLDRIAMIMNQSISIDKAQSINLEQILTRLKTNEPIQHVIGTAPFWGRDFEVNKNVLIPRQETELLIELIINYRDWNNPTILDIGTGSGCIPITLDLEIPSSIIHSLDISQEALEVAKRNNQKLNSNVNFDKVDILSEGLPLSNLDIIVSNPPYVMNKEKPEMAQNVLVHEPHLALFVSDEDPLIFYRIITQKATLHLANHGVLLFEINERLGDETADLLLENGFDKVTIHLDLNDKQRFVSGQWSC
ncbi:MAG: peptide chain release factor N(5)-glutamine methyltransferase [Reichenbachiella sp.]